MDIQVWFTTTNECQRKKLKLATTSEGLWVWEGSWGLGGCSGKTLGVWADDDDEFDGEYDNHGDNNFDDDNNDDDNCDDDNCDDDNCDDANRDDDNCDDDNFDDDNYDDDNCDDDDDGGDYAPGAAVAVAEEH